MNERLKTFEEKMKKQIGNLGRGTFSNPCRTCESKCVK